MDNKKMDNKLKVLIINSSPHYGENSKGTSTAVLNIFCSELQQKGVDSEIVELKTGPFEACRACGFCRKNGKCVIDDQVNEIAKKATECDGFIFASPTHYAGMSGSLKSVMSRLFFSAGKHLRFKPAAGISVARRAGQVAVLDEINKYLTINNMPVVPSSYWNIVFGANGEEALQDAEGIDTVKQLAQNMIWMLKSFANAKEDEVVPVLLEKRWTNFIRD